MRLITRFNWQIPVLNELFRPIAASCSPTQLPSPTFTVPSTHLSSPEVPAQKVAVTIPTSSPGSRKPQAQSRRVASICTGAFLLAEAGLLNGKQAVTHWSFCDRLAREYPKVVVRPEPIYLRDGSIYTSAGITAGIDLSLALVEEDHGHETALKIARFLVMFLVRPGGQAQYSHMLSHQAITSQPLRELQVWMLQHLREDLTVESLAERIGMSARHFTRVCLRETGMNPGQFVDRMRVEAAQQIIDSSSRGLKEIADSCGFKSADAMRRTFLRVLGVTAAEYASRFKSTLVRASAS